MSYLKIGLTNKGFDNSFNYSQPYFKTMIGIMYLITPSLITSQTVDIICNTPPTVRHFQQLSSIVETAVTDLSPLLNAAI